MERRLAAILIADVVGYSKTMGMDESHALNSIRLLREELFEPEVSKKNGKIVKRLGDGWIVEFPSVVDAVRCAIDVQKNVEAIEDLKLRIGIHLGDIVQEGGEIYGEGINIAARLESIGAPGLVLISDDVKRHISAAVQEDFHDLGPIELKNIMEPVRVWSWPNTPIGITRYGVLGKKPSVFVRQFEARGEGAADLAGSIRDDLLTVFGRQSGISLVTVEDKADFVLAGSVTASNNRWRITTRLDNLDSKQTEWSDRFDEVGSDPFDILDRCVTRVSGAVRIRLPALLSRKAEEEGSLDSMSPEDLLNHAMSCHFTPTVDSWDRAVEALEIVLNRDGRNWMAMAMMGFNLASRHRLFGWRINEMPPPEGVRESIENALALKPDSEVVRLVQGVYFFYIDRNPVSARLHVDESLRLNPDYYHSINMMSQIELADGNLEVAAEYALRAADCDPGYPYLHLYLRDLGYVLLLLEKYEEACNKFERATLAAPGLPRNLIGKIASSRMAGNPEYAENAKNTLLALIPDFNIEDYDPWPLPSPEDWPEFKMAFEAVD